jgi:hypothetical protein
MVGEGSKLAGTCSELAGTHFKVQKKIPMKIPEFKRSGIRIIVEFHGIPSGFPNQGSSLGDTHPSQELPSVFVC